jgi:hypothetical protein
MAVNYQGLELQRRVPIALKLLKTGNTREEDIAHSLLLEAGAWFVQDLGSAAGTFVNGQRIQATRLNPGDQIQVGTSILVLTLPT